MYDALGLDFSLLPFHNMVCVAQKKDLKILTCLVCDIVEVVVGSVLKRHTCER